MARLPVHRVRAQASPGALGPDTEGVRGRGGGAAAVFAGMGPRLQPGEELPLQDADRTARSSHAASCPPRAPCLSQVHQVSWQAQTQGCATAPTPGSRPWPLKTQPGQEG